MAPAGEMLTRLVSEAERALGVAYGTCGLGFASTQQAPRGFSRTTLVLRSIFAVQRISIKNSILVAEASNSLQVLDQIPLLGIGEH